MKKTKTLFSLEIKVDKNIPIPRTKGGRYPIYPWHTMEIGDSFLSKSAPGTTRTLASRMSKILKGKRFSVRSLGGGETRVWRIK